MSDSFWTTVNAGWFGVAVGLLFGIFALWIGFLQYSRSRVIRRLRYSSADVSLISGDQANGYDGLTVLFDGQEVPQVTSTSFGLWNDGTETIDGSSIVPSDPLRLTINGGGTILRASVQATHRVVNAPSVAITTPTELVVTFEYLDPGDGFRLQVVHSGRLGSVSSLGSIKGLPQGIQTFQTAGWIVIIDKCFDKAFRFLVLPLVLFIVGSMIFDVARKIALLPRSQWLPYSALGVIALFIISLAFWSPFPKKKSKVPQVIAADPRLLSPVYPDDKG